jgi:hypothetical protein
MNIKKRRSYIHSVNNTMSSEYTYEVESDIDFFKELKKITKITVDKTASSLHEPELDTTPRCLITDDKLRKDHITLECGHKFNYVPLFKDVLFQKCYLLPKNISSKLVTTYTKNSPSSMTIPSSSSSSSASSSSSSATMSKSNILSITYNSSYNLEITKLQYNEIKCPYCRTITPFILPFYPYPDVCKVKYVNTPSNLSLPALSCEYDNFISGENTVFTTNEKTGCGLQCTYHEKYDRMLCSKHFNKLEVGVSPSRKNKKGSSLPQMKLRSRTCISNDTCNPTTAHDSSAAVTQNIIISHHNPATASCSFTLLSGNRKGCPCGKPMWIPKTSASSTTNAIHDTGLPAYCKTHYNKCIPL